MGKKRVDRTSFSFQNRKAQVTIFIILGLVIFFVFILMFTTVSKVKKGQLEMEKEGIFDQIFKKEAMRIYVEDCLSDELEKGLVLLGNQGRFWSDQPGGIKPFVPKETGLEYGGERIFYGITKQKYPLGSENAYPCKDNSFSPEFCQYSFPNLSMTFGQLQLMEIPIEEDLGRYLANRTVWCVENYTKTNISSKAKIESTKMDMTVQILEDGISVKADYPLKFSLGNQEFFQLTTFDFFYSSKFKPFLRAAIAYPLDYDRKYSDFNYTPEMLERDSFNYSSDKNISSSCQKSEDHFLCTKMNPYFENYKALNINLNLENYQGDDIFTFSTDKIGEILHDQTYSYQIARQNRPPALDYVNRFACPAGGYDYLVIKDDLDYGLINIQLSAKDPDEDKVSYNFKNLPQGGSVGNTVTPTLPGPTPPPPPPGNFMFPALFLPEDKIINFTAEAIDDHNLKDWQVVRVFTDMLVIPELFLRMPYVITSAGVSNEGIFQKDNVYFVSKEDPVLIEYNSPGLSINPGDTTTSEVTLKYSSTNTEINFGIDQDNPKGCISLPEKVSDDCEDYLEEYDIKNIFDYAGGVFTETGNLTLTSKKNYCENLVKESPTSLKVAVRECIPYQNKTHPWPSPNEKLEYGLDSKGNTNLSDYKGEKKTNPFLASHTCCWGNIDDPFSWGLAPENTICFINPIPDCSGGIPGLTDLPNKDGFLLEEEFATCNGDRGNICDGIPQYRLVNNKDMVCGKPAWNNDCKSIDKFCRGQPAYGYVDIDGNGANEVWCHGTLGCSKICKKVDGPISADYVDIPADMNQKAEDDYKGTPPLPPDLDNDYGLFCGCKQGKKCDFDYDGKFDGICKQTLASASGSFECCNPGIKPNEEKDAPNCDDI